MFFVKIVFVVLLIRLLLHTNKPVLCAGIYAVLSFISGLLFGGAFYQVAIGSVISFGLAFIYFWLLDRFEESWGFWVVLFVGLLIGLV